MEGFRLVVFHKRGGSISRSHFVGNPCSGCRISSFKFSVPLSWLGCNKKGRDPTQAPGERILMFEGILYALGRMWKKKTE